MKSLDQAESEQDPLILMVLTMSVLNDASALTIVEILVKLGCKVDVESWIDMKSPLSIAIRHSWVKTAKFLVQSGASLANLRQEYVESSY